MEKEYFSQYNSPERRFTYKMKPILEKRGKGEWKTALIVAFFVVVVLVGFGAVMQNTNPDPNKDITTCDSTTTPNLTINAFDTENVGSALTEATNLYRKQGTNTWNTFTAGTGFDVSVGETYEIVMGISTTDQTDNAYGSMFEYTVPCEENPEIEYEMANDEVETSLTATFYNNDGDAGAETFSAGQTQDVSIKFQAGVDEYFGNPFLDDDTPNVLCLDLNSTTWDKPEEVSIKGGADLNSVSTPQRHSAVAGKIAYCYEAPVISEDQIEIVIKANADDSTAPAVDDTAYIYAGGHYVNADTGEVEVGVEDEDGNAVGTDASDSVTLDWTA